MTPKAAKSKTKNDFLNNFVTRRISIAEVHIAKGRRALNDEKVRSMAKSMDIVGQRQPITVRKRKDSTLWLVSGRHRLAAAKLLDWTEVAGFIIHASKWDAELCEGVENIYRAELSALDRAIAIDRMRKALIAKAKKDEKVAGGKQPGDVGINKVARLLGVDKADIQRAMKIGKIEAEARIKIVKQQFDDTQNALLTIANEATLQAQLTKIRELASAKKKRSGTAITKRSKRADEVPDVKSPATAPGDEDQEFEALQDLYDQSSSGAQVRIARYIRQHQKSEGRAFAH